MIKANKKVWPGMVTLYNEIAKIQNLKKMSFRRPPNWEHYIARFFGKKNVIAQGEESLIVYNWRGITYIYDSSLLK